jgi:hypothetical protein
MIDTAFKMRKVSLWAFAIFILVLLYFGIIIAINHQKYPTQFNLTSELANHVITTDYYSWQIYGFVYTNFHMDQLRNLRDGVWTKDMVTDKNIDNWYPWATSFMNDGISYSYIPERLISGAMHKINYTHLHKYEDWAESKVIVHRYQNATVAGQ